VDEVEETDQPQSNKDDGGGGHEDDGK